MREPLAVPLALLVFVVLSTIALPVQNAITRHMEEEADWIALETTHTPTAPATSSRASRGKPCSIPILPGGRTT